jgi:formimidoylglutamate deiminase
MSTHGDGSASTGQSWHIGRALLPSGWAADVRITIADGCIASVETDQRPRDDDLQIKVGLPGMPNLHSHGFQRAMAGLTEVRGAGDDGFWTWRSLMYRFVERLSPDMVEAITAFAYLEMLESGFTRVGEFHYLHHDVGGGAYSDPAEMGGRVASAAAATGMGLTLLPVFYAHSDFGGRPATDGQRRFLSTPDSYARLLEACWMAVRGCEGAVVGIAPHSLRAVSPDELALILPLGGGGPVHIHIAEQTAEVEACMRWSGARPIDWLLANCSVDGRWCLVHATHATEAEVAGIAQSGAVVGLCPITEANLGDGLFPASHLVAMGGRYGIGSDSNVRIDVAAELRLLEYGQRLAARSRNVLAAGAGRSTGRAVYEAAMLGGAQALGVRGGLSSGARADLVVVDPEHALLVGRTDDALIDTLVFAGARDAIAQVWAAGTLQVEHGRHRRREPIERAYRAAMRALLET